MRHFTILSTLSLTLFYVLPALAITGGKAWVNFYKDCPNEIIEIDRVTFVVSSLEQSPDSQVQGLASPTISPPSSIRPSGSASVFPSSSTLPIASKKTQLRSSLFARDAEQTTLRSPSVNITQGQCQAVPIVTSAHIDSRSVSVEAELITVTPFQECNITIHEVPGCIDEPLLVAPVKNREAESNCVARNFDSYNDVWVRLECSEIGTGSVQKRVSRTRPVRRVF